MDARERAYKISCIVWDSSEEVGNFDELTERAKNDFSRGMEAAVRTAYEIDGVMELVEAAEAMAKELHNVVAANPREWGLNKEEVGPEFEMWAKSRCAYTLELHGSAAARVREAIGATTSDGGKDGGGNG